MGALTSKPYAFYSRPWELSTVNSIDLYEPLLSLIRFDLRGLDVLRVLPRIDHVNDEEWINDRIRFFYQGFQYQRNLSVKLRRFFPSKRVNLILAVLTVIVANSWGNLVNSEFWFSDYDDSQHNLDEKLPLRHNFAYAAPYFSSTYFYDFIQPLVSKYILDIETARVKDVFLFRWLLKKNSQQSSLVSYRRYLLDSNLISSKLNAVDLFLVMDVNLRVLSPLLFLWVKQKIDTGCTLVYWGLPIMLNIPIVDLGFKFKLVETLVKGKLYFWQNLLHSVTNILCIQSFNLNLDYLKGVLMHYKLNLELFLLSETSKVTLELFGSFQNKESSFEKFYGLNFSKLDLNLFEHFLHAGYQESYFELGKISKSVFRYLIKLNFFYKVQPYLFGKASVSSSFSLDLLTHQLVSGKDKDVSLYFPILTAFEVGGKFLSISSLGLIREAEPLNILPLSQKVGSIKNFLLALDHFIYFFTASFNIFINLLEFQSGLDYPRFRGKCNYKSVNFKYKEKFFPYFYLDYFPPAYWGGSARSPQSAFVHYFQVPWYRLQYNCSSFFEIHFPEESSDGCYTMFNILETEFVTDAFWDRSFMFSAFPALQGVDEYYSYQYEGDSNTYLLTIKSWWKHTWQGSKFLLENFFEDYAGTLLEQIYHNDFAPFNSINPVFKNYTEAFSLKPPFQTYNYQNGEGFIFDLDFFEFWTDLNYWQLPDMAFPKKVTQQYLWNFYSKVEDFYLRDGITKAAPVLNIGFKRFKKLTNY